MSRRNGDRSRFQINRRRKLQHRQTIQKLLKTVAADKAAVPVARTGAA